MSRDGNGNGKDDVKGVLGRWDATSDEIREAMTLGIYRALREHKRLGVPAVTWDHERQCIVVISPEEIVVPDEPDDPEDPTA